MIAKITYADETDAEYTPTEYVQFGVISIDTDKQYAIIDDGQDTYYEIEAIAEKQYYMLSTHHVATEEYESINTDRKFISLEILTDSLAVIQKWEAQ